METVLRGKFVVLNATMHKEEKYKHNISYVKTRIFKMTVDFLSSPVIKTAWY